MDQAARALSLYRAIFRAARGLPNLERTTHVLHRLRADYRRHAALTESTEIEALLQLGDVHLQNLQLQADHLSALVEAERAGNGKFNPVVLPGQRVKRQRRGSPAIKTPLPNSCE